MQPVYDRLHVHLREQVVIHADETTAQVLHEDDKISESKSYIWLYTSGAFEEHRIVIYEYQPTRGGYHAAKFLADYHGYVHTDGFSGYNRLKDVTRCGCWAHLRRYMFEAVPKKILNGVERYYAELTKMDFISKIFYCMATFQAPYKSVLVSLYEYAVQSKNEELCCKIKEVFDLQFDNFAEKFQMLGLDDSLVTPSYVINTSSLQEKIKKSMEINPELNYHKDNEPFLKNIMTEISMIIRRS